MACCRLSSTLPPCDSPEKCITQHDSLSLFTVCPYGRGVEYYTGRCLMQQMIHGCNKRCALKWPGKIKVKGARSPCVSWVLSFVRLPFAAYKAYMCERGKWYHRANMSHGVQVKASTLQVCVCAVYTEEAGAESWWKLNLHNSSAA